MKPGKSGQSRRLQMSTTQTLQMFFRTQRQSVQPADTAKVLRDEAQVEMTKGPFGKTRFVSTEGHVDEGAKGEALTNGLIAAIEAAGIDEPENRLIVLDPTQFTLLNGVDSETRMAISAALGLHAPDGWSDGTPWPTPMSVVYASSCVFAVVNTYRRNHAVAAATDYVAWRRVAEISNVSSDPGLLERARSQVRDKKAAVRANLRKAYQHVVYLGEAREAVSVRLDKDNQSALDGDLVWKTLAERDKAFGPGEFDRDALMFQLRDSDYGKSLAAIRADFYRSPRLPLLHDGDTDLKKAIYAAQQAGNVVILNASGQETVPTRPGDINITSSGLILERPHYTEPGVEPAMDGAVASGSDHGEPLIRGSHDHGVGSRPTGGASPPTHADGVNEPSKVGVEQTVVMSLMGSTFDNRDDQDAAYNLFTALATAVDSAQVSFGKFQTEVTVPPDFADELVAHAHALGVSASTRDV